MIFGEGPIIKNIAGDLNKLFLQGSRVGQPVTNVEGDAAADQGTADLPAAMDPVIQEVAVGMSGEESMQYTVSGTPPLTLTKSLGKLLKSWSVELLPYQEGTGDPSPTNIRVIHGTNKLNLFVEESYDQSATPKAVIDMPVISANKWDEVWENGYYDSLGNPSSPSANYIRSKNYIKVTPNAQYYCATGTSYNFCLQFYDENKGFLLQDFTFRDSVVTIPSNCYYIRFWRNESEYRYNIAINFPSTVTTYNPYNATVYMGTIENDICVCRWGKVDLGTLTYSKYSDTNKFYAPLPAGVKPYPASSTDGAICERYTKTTYSGIQNPTPNGTFEINTQSTYIYIHDDSFAGNTAAQFKQAMSGIKLVYELANPIQVPLTTPDITTPRGDAAAWAVSEDGIVDSMEATYVGKT